VINAVNLCEVGCVIQRIQQSTFVVNEIAATTQKQTEEWFMHGPEMNHYHFNAGSE
jgi:hypothetical protein